jgi:omega-6 fatty acid desaturase (delta-12 desaturase)
VYVRTGKDLIKASKEFADEDRARTWRLLLGTFLAQGLTLAYIALVPWWQAAVLGSIVSGLISVRLFIFFHDYCHGAIFRGSKLGDAVMTVVGWTTMTVPSVWTETHNYHHRNNAKMVGSSIGSYPTVSLGMYKALSDVDRRNLRLVRSPWSMLFGLFTTFVIGMCVLPWRRSPEAHRLAPVAGVVWWSVLALMAVALGPLKAFLLMLLPAFVWSSVGSYLFYAQHNYPGAELRGRRDWDYTHAALRCSSYFEMSPLMHWFTGNIGYHHVHHLNHNIPFYRLPEAMAGMPELQDPGRTSWAWHDVKACLDCAVWDPEQGRLISFAEADAKIQASAIAAK